MNQSKSILYRICLILLLLLILSNTTVIANIITVKQDGTGDYITIMEAIDASSDGDIS